MSICATTCARTRPGPTSGVEQGLDALRVVVLEAMNHVELLLAHGELVVAFRGGQQPTLLVDDRDLVGFQVGNAGGHEVDDGLDLLLLEAPALFELQEYRGARALVVANECGWRGTARCTRAPSTGRRAAMVRASSVSSACW